MSTKIGPSAHAVRRNHVTQTKASEFIAAAHKAGFTITVRDSIVTITKRFAPGDTAAFAECDGAGPMVLSLAPLKGGSVWGTDGGSVGGYSAVKNGCYTLNKSGNGKRFLAAVAGQKEMEG